MIPLQQSNKVSNEKLKEQSSNVERPGIFSVKSPLNQALCLQAIFNQLNIPKNFQAYAVFKLTNPHLSSL